MSFKRIVAGSLTIVVVLSFPVFAQLTKLYHFKKVQIPFNLKHEDTIIQKGKYDFEFLRHQTQPIFYLKIRKGSKVLCQLLGEKLEYEGYGWDKMRDPDIPKKPKMSMSRIPVRKDLYIIFETGKDTQIYPLIKVRFQLKYEE
jgi:hypothetical protein